MIWLDWVIVALFAYNVGGGLMNGLVRSLFNLAALVGAYLFTPVVRPLVIATVQGVFQLEPYLAIPIGVGLTWTLIYLGISMVGNAVGYVVNKTPLKILDRLWGMTLGFVVSCVIVMLPVALVESIPLVRDLKPVKEAIAQSTFLPVLRPLTDMAQTTVGPMIVNFWLQKDQAELQKSLPKASPSPVKPQAKPPAKPPAKPAVPARQPA